MDLSNFITKCNNANMGMNSIHNGFPLFVNIFNNIHGYTHYANKIICILDHGTRGRCLSFKFVPIVVVYDKY